MQSTSIVITRKIKEGIVEVENEKNFCRWITYSTGKENVILIRAFTTDGINEVTYDTMNEEFYQALKRAINKRVNTSQSII